jgi:hypothetical protein
MNDRSQSNPLHAQEAVEAFTAAGVDYVFIGKGGAIRWANLAVGCPVDECIADRTALPDRIQRQRRLSSLLMPAVNSPCSIAAPP